MRHVALLSALGLTASLALAAPLGAQPSNRMRAAEAGATAAAGAAPAVVLALDTSRSLSPRALADTSALLAAIADGVPSGTPIGVLAFDDEPRWLLPADSPNGPGAAAAALQGVAPQGRFTLLNDALFSAARGLPAGGVLVLATDGRDENSATTVEDVTSLCVANHVRIVAVGAGNRIDDKAMRRLAWLTGGTYVGPSNSVDMATVARAIGEGLGAAQQVAAKAAAASAVTAAPAPSDASSAPPVVAPATAAPAAPAATPVAAAPTASVLDSWLLPLILLLAVLALAAGVLGALLWRGRRAGGTPTFCERCGSELPPGTTECPQCAIDAVEQKLRQCEVAPPGTARPMRADTAVFKVPFEQAIEHTFVMQAEPLLEVREPGAEKKSYRLSTERAFGIGRDSKLNTLGIADPTLSSRHFRIVPEGSAFYLLDESSTNGSFVNGKKTRCQALEPGDVITAGQVEFGFRVQHERSIS
jgi:hypothetical protein